MKLAEAPPGARVLDVATGTGKQAFAFARRGYDAVGVDLSEDMLARARKHNRYANVRLENADAAHLPFENDSFDVSCVSFALHDMPGGIREAVLEEMARVTRGGGRIIIVDYTQLKNKRGRRRRRLAYRMALRFESPYYPEFMESDLDAMLERQGIRVEKRVPIFADLARITTATNTK